MMSANEQLHAVCAGAEDPHPAPAAAVVVAHPDDEVVGAGARLPRLCRATFVHVTDGSPHNLYDAHNYGFATREEYAAARRREVLAALALAGIGPGQVRDLGCVDQEASARLVDLSRALAALLGELRPEVVLTHPYEGGHPDHDATAFIVHAACRLTEAQGGLSPTVIEMTSYHNGPNGITPYEFLPGDGGEEITRVLSECECDFKRRVLDCFPTQQGTLQYFPVGIERFRLAPRYDFTRPPHEGTLFYECFDWGRTGAQFRDLAREAQETLGIAGLL